MKRVFVKRILRPSSVSRLMQPGDESLLVRFTDRSGQVLHASQFNTLSESHFSVQTTRATSLFSKRSHTGARRFAIYVPSFSSAFAALVVSICKIEKAVRRALQKWTLL